MWRRSAVPLLVALSCTVGGCGVTVGRRSLAPEAAPPSFPVRATDAPKPAGPPLTWGVVVVAKEGLVWVPVNAKAGAQRLVESSPAPAEGMSAAISPDHRKVALFNESGELRLFDLQTGKAAVITILGEDDRHFVASCPWSPDSRQVAFIKDGNIQVATLEGRARQLTTTGDAGSLGWSPDGQRIAFGRRDKKDQDVGLWVVPAAGGETTQLAAKSTQDPVFAASGPVWSPDGKTVAFLHSWEGAGLCFVGADGTGLTQDVDSAWFPLHWLPDNSAVVYNAFNPESGSEGLKLCSPTGKPKTVVAGSVAAFDAIGTDLLVAVDKTPPDATEPLGWLDLMVVGPDGQKRLKGWSLTVKGSGAECRWCPDGVRVAVLSKGLDEKSDPVGELLVGVPGGELKPLGDGAEWLVGWACVEGAQQ